MYELSIGGKRNDSAAIVYDNLLDLNISENPTAVGSWDASIPYTREHESSLMENVYVYYEGEIIFRGILESVESSFDDSSTKVSGRGILIELEYQADSASYSNTTVYDALSQYWANNTDFDASVLYSNRDFADEKYISTDDFRQKFNNINSEDAEIAKYYFDATNSRLYPTKLNYTEDVETSASTIATDGSDTTDAAYSKQTAVRFDGGSGSYLDYSYSYDSDYSPFDFKWFVRIKSSTISDATLDFYVNGTHARSWSLSSTSISHQWLDVLNDSRLSTINTVSNDLTTAPTFRLEVSGLASDEWVDIDAVSITNEDLGTTYTLPGSTNSDGVYTGPEWYPDNQPADARNDIGEADFVPSQATDRIGIVVDTEEKLPSFSVQVENKDTGEVVTETHNHRGVSNHHVFDFQFSEGTGTDFVSTLRFDSQYPATQAESGETWRPNVSRMEMFAPDVSKFVTIDEAEFNGTTFEILKSLHDRGSYRFTVTDYENEVVESYPLGTRKDEPFWTIKSEKRKLDYTNYANKVTVQGKTKSDGTYNSATVSNQDEIDVLGRTVEKYEKNPEVVTQSEVDSRAASLLEEKVSEKDESGSMDVVPQQIDVGYNYPISTWSDAFRYGGRIGTNALNFRGDDGAPDKVVFEARDWNNSTDYYTFEFLLHPRNLDEMGDDEWRGILGAYGSNATPGYNDLVTLYGDGSVGVGYNDGDSLDNDGYRARSGPGVINNNEAQRLSVVFGLSDSDGVAIDDWEIYVDGQLQEIVHPQNSFTAYEISRDTTDFKIGVDSYGGHPFDGGIDDVRLFYERRTESQINQYAYEDLLTSTSVDVANLAFYLRFDDRSDPTTAVVERPSRSNIEAAPITGATYEASFGRLEEIQYSLGTDGNLSLDFDISGRVDTELVKTRNEVRSNRRNL